MDFLECIMQRTELGTETYTLQPPSSAFKVFLSVCLRKGVSNKV